MHLETVYTVAFNKYENFNALGILMEKYEIYSSYFHLYHCQADWTVKKGQSRGLDRMIQSTH
jgi:hypothetical protein